MKRKKMKEKSCKRIISWWNGQMRFIVWGHSPDRIGIWKFWSLKLGENRSHNVSWSWHVSGPVFRFQKLARKRYLPIVSFTFGRLKVRWFTLLTHTYSDRYEPFEILEIRLKSSFLQFVAQQCCVAICDCLLPVLPPPRATIFHVAKSWNGRLHFKPCFYFLQQENLFHAEVVIRTTNNRNM